MEKMLELQSIADIVNVFTDKLHCNLTMKELVKAVTETANHTVINTAVIIVPANLVFDIFNAIMFDCGQEYDGIEFEYNNKDNQEHEIFIAHDGILYNKCYNADKDCQCLLSVYPLRHNVTDNYYTVENSFILFHSSCSDELLNSLTDLNNANRIITFDLIEE